MGRVRAVRRSPFWRLGLAATDATVGVETLLPQERALVVGATSRRGAEFATGRHCARQALASIDHHHAGMPVLRDQRGAPEWPTGVVGSITHCDGWTGAVVARSTGSGPWRGIRALGLDAEPVAPLPPGVLEVVATADERGALARLGDAQPGIPWDTLLFTAKEATYKAWYPLTGLLVGHEAVGVELSPTGSFTAVASAPDAAGRQVVQRVRGRWALGPRVVVAIAVVG
jgi:4'-phosphopantetheinyl transferase EntD